MRGEVLHDCGRVPIVLPERLQECDHPRRIDPGREEHSHPRSVRLLLVPTAVLQRAKGAGTLDRVGHRAGRIAGEGGDEESGRRVLEQRAGGVAMEDVLDLVGEYAGQLFRASGPLKQPPEEHDVAAGGGERVHRRVVHYDDPEGIRRLWGRRDQGGDNAIDHPGANGVCAPLFGRRKVVGDRSPEALLPRGGDASRGDLSEGRDAPEVEGCCDPDRGHGRQDGERHTRPATAGVVEAPGQLRGHLVQGGEK